MREDFHSIRYPASVDRGLGALSEEQDYVAHVEQLIKQLLFTAPGERVNRPDFGCGLRRLVFAPNNPAAGTLAKISVTHALNTWLSDVLSVEDVAIESADATLSVKIRYILKARQERRYLNLEVAL
ncbi:MAG: GPW/gp25 family protein [Deltaproteobacteria bacterium]|nr:MAG: GPW/gp25 family protein [Deltaproteobacteria bacterium]TMQ12985.1 MAG: GPW/gp25 family protein [Deltaproteobacteria bacterium]